MASLPSSTGCLRFLTHYTVEFFDNNEHSVLMLGIGYYNFSPDADDILQTGALTSGLSEKPEKIGGLAGITLGACVTVLVRSLARLTICSVV